MNYASRSIASGIFGIISMVLLLGMLPAYAQRPEIKSIHTTQGSYGQVISLKGNSFGTSSANLVVMFGAAKATIKSVTDQVLEVRVPAGATYDNISVTNITSGLTGYSREQFFINFQGDGSGFSIANLQGQYDFPGTPPGSAEGLFDLCMCDLDGDGKTDVAAAKTGVQAIEYYINASPAPGTIAFNKASTGTSYNLRHVQCGDLNGDGKPDLIATDADSNGKLLIFKNNSTPGAVSIASQPAITFPGKTPKRMEIADLDLDGKPELIITDENAPGSVIVLKNQSTTAAISFASTPLVILLPNAQSTSGLAVQDLDGDMLPEIVTSQFVRTTNVYVVKNTSTPGNLSLTNITEISTGTLINNLRIGDVDGDGKPDIAFTQITPSNAIGMLLNQSTSSSLAFSLLTSSNVPAFAFSNVVPFGLDMGDMDGDGKLEIVVASFTTSALAILKNESTAGSVSFTQFVKTPTNSINQHVAVGDVDNDGKPDIVFTSVDNTNLGINASKIAVLRNAACMKPVVTPAGPINICAGNTDPVVLTATLGGGVTYKWTNTTTSTTTPGTNEFTPTVDGSYFVTATAAGCTPDRVSNTVVFSMTTAAALIPSSATSNSPICAGVNLTLSTADQGAGYTYKWSGPNNFTSTLRAPQITSAQLENAGEYTVQIFAPSGCLLKTYTTTASIITYPSFSVDGGPAMNKNCGAASFVTLKVFPASADFSYSWYRNGTALGNTTTTQTMDAAGGDYYYKVQSLLAACPPEESSHYTYTVISDPVPSFTLVKPSACQGEAVLFTNTSDWDNTQTPTFLWTFGDGQTSTDESPTHTFTSTNGGVPFTVKLTVSHANTTCAKDFTETIEITSAPPLTITNSDNQYKLCPDGSLELEASTGFSSYLWKVSGETTESITISEPGEYTVEASAANGCKLTTSRTITEFDGPEVEATATPSVINEGEQTQLSANNLLDYTWEPAETISDPSIAEPTATPLVSTSYSVSGKDVNGCTRQATVVVEVRGNAIVTKLFPGNFFSPNGDDQNPYWVVGQIDQYPQCGVVIYDDKGVKVFDSQPYQNNWDGTFNGKKLPDGVYYFVIRCEGEESKPRMGSITILR